CCHDTFLTSRRYRPGFCFRCRDCRRVLPRDNLPAALPATGSYWRGISSPLPCAVFDCRARTGSRAHPVRTASWYDNLAHANPERECCRLSGYDNRLRKAFSPVVFLAPPGLSPDSSVLTLRGCEGFRTRLRPPVPFSPSSRAPVARAFCF